MKTLKKGQEMTQETKEQFLYKLLQKLKKKEYRQVLKTLLSNSHKHDWIYVFGLETLGWTRSDIELYKKDNDIVALYLIELLVRDFNEDIARSTSS